MADPQALPTENSEAGRFARQLALLLGPAYQPAEGTRIAADLYGLGQALADASANNNAAIAEAFATTASDLIGELEIRYGLPAWPTAALQDRRDRLVAKIRAARAGSPQGVISAINALVGLANATVIENLLSDVAADPRAIFLWALKIPVDDWMDADTLFAIRAIGEQMKPAHTRCNVTTQIGFLADDAASLVDRDLVRATPATASMPSGLVWDFCADRLVSDTGGLVDSWDSQVPTDTMTGSGGSRPTKVAWRNGRKGIEFAGAHELIIASLSTPIAQPATVLIALEAADATGARTIYIDGDVERLFQNGGDIDAMADTTIMGPGTLAEGHVLVILLDGGSSKLLLDNVEIASGWLTSGNAIVDAFALGGLTAGTPWTGTIGAIYVWDRALSVDEIEYATALQRNYYGI